MLTLQQIFDKALFAIRAQGGPSMRETEPELCAYRGANGAKCAIGHFIPDSAYDPAFDVVGGGVRSAIRNLPQFGMALTGEGVDVSDPEVVEFLEQIQMAHDNATDAGDFMAVFNQSMRLLAKRAGLVYTESAT